MTRLGSTRRTVWRLMLIVSTILAGRGVALYAADYLGPTALVASKDGRVLFVAAEEGRQVLRVDVDGRTVAGIFPLPARPSGLALTPDGTKLVVTCGIAESTILVIDTASGVTIATIRVGHAATGPVATPDGKRLYVANRFDNDVSVIDLETGAPLARVPVTREPVASAITPDGKSVLIANHLPSGRSNSFYVTPVVTIIDVRTHETTEIRLPNGSTGLRGACVSPDGRHAYVTHILGNYELVPAQVVGGWTSTNVISVIDVAAKKLVNTVALDDMSLGAANPWGVAVSADGKWICVAHAGTDELSVIDAPAMLDALYGGRYTGPPASGIPNSPSILAGLRRRIALPGKGSRAVAIVGRAAYVAQYFSDTLAVVDLEPEGEGRADIISLGPKPQWTARRRGQVLFHDATICYQHWQSCATCHPDARADALNWDLLNDGVGNPKNTRSMLLAHRTPPAMSVGIRATAELAVRSGLEHILFADQPEEDAAAIDAYLKSLQPVPSPHLIGGGLSPEARRGKALFESDEVNCHQCHPPPLYTDLRTHNVGTQGPYDHHPSFDTPTLVEAWRTAPYLHDGRYATIRKLIADGKHGNTRGSVEKLREQEIDALVEFVLSL